ncbi:hypothetical protein DFQ27_003830 [Actinomortierella ambigua]|uniref:Uncharacterized protein n=1 Tax=Actinomortierella ambigua TaxID=1343610 RepID=A0A9P6U5B9_9FUNG|nr:hypothetical protein DFQ27_003830 [Actinomortierella ambigua]
MGTTKIAGFGLAIRKRQCRDRAGTTHIMPPELINRTRSRQHMTPLKVGYLGSGYNSVLGTEVRPAPPPSPPPWEQASYAAPKIFSQDFFYGPERLPCERNQAWNRIRFLLLLGLLHLGPSRRTQRRNQAPRQRAYAAAARENLDQIRTGDGDAYDPPYGLHQFIAAKLTVSSSTASGPLSVRNANSASSEFPALLLAALLFGLDV